MFSNDRFEGVFQWYIIVSVFLSNPLLVFHGLWPSFSPGLPVDQGLYELNYMEPFNPNAQDSVLFITVHTQSHNLIFSWVPLDSFFLNMQVLEVVLFTTYFVFLEFIIFIEPDIVDLLVLLVGLVCLFGFSFLVLILVYKREATHVIYTHDNNTINPFSRSLFSNSGSLYQKFIYNLGWSKKLIKYFLIYKLYYGFTVTWGT